MVLIGDVYYKQQAATGNNSNTCNIALYSSKLPSAGISSMALVHIGNEQVNGYTLHSRFGRAPPLQRNDTYAALPRLYQALAASPSPSTSTPISPASALALFKQQYQFRLPPLLLKKT